MLASFTNAAARCHHCTQTALAFVALFVCVAVTNAQPADEEFPVVTTPLQVLELLGIGESELAGFEHDSAFSDDEFITLHRLLARLPRFPRHRMTTWQRTDVVWADQLQNASELEATIVRVAGQLTELTREELPEAIAERVRYTHFYKAVIADASQDVEYTAFLRDIPNQFSNALIEGQPLIETVALTGLFLKSGVAKEAGESEPSAELANYVYLAANYLEWFPNNPESPLVVERKGLLHLAEFGMDVGVLGSVKDRKPLVTDDREGFYQLLASVGTQRNSAIKKLSSETNATALLKEPAKHRGQFYTMNGTARRCIRIQVDDPDIVNRFGITHYYEIEVFDQSAFIRVKDREDTDRSAVYDSYPIVFCTRSIPEGFPTGDLIHENVQINGAYLKLWAYATRFIRTQIGEDGGAPPLQISPLLVGHSPMFLRPPPSRGLGVFSAIGFTAAILGIWGLIAWNKRGDAKFRRETIDRHVNLDWEIDSEENVEIEDALTNLKTTLTTRSNKEKP